MLKTVKSLIALLEDLAERLPTLPEVSDADMALMYLRHLLKQLQPNPDKDDHVKAAVRGAKGSESGTSG